LTSDIFLERTTCDMLLTGYSSWRMYCLWKPRIMASLLS